MISDPEKIGHLITDNRLGGSLRLESEPGAAATAQTAKQQCINTCRARYRDCRRLNQLPSFECRGVYQDCTRFTCNGLGPG